MKVWSAANKRLYLCSRCDFKWLFQTPYALNSDGKSESVVLGSRLHICMRVAWERLPPQSFPGTVLSDAVGDQWFQTIAQSILSFSAEWKPCAVWVSGGHSGETCWQLWTALRCTSARDPSARFTALFSSALLPPLAVSQSHVLNFPTVPHQSSIAINECTWCLRPRASFWSGWGS